MNVLRVCWGRGSNSESSRECACALCALSRTPLAHTPQNAQGSVTRRIAVAFEAKQVDSAERGRGETEIGTGVEAYTPVLCKRTGAAPACAKQKKNA